MNYKFLYITLLSSLLLPACSTENGMEPVLDDRPIELSFRVNDYIRDGGALRATDDGSDAEQAVTNLYLFLFNAAGTTPVRYYIDAHSFTGGTYTAGEKRISLNMTRAEAGERQVYIVANCADLEAELDAVTTVTELQTVYRNNTAPWFSNIPSPILMTGNATHNFLADTPNAYRLEDVPLTRAVAKIELTVKLTSGFRVVPTVNNENLEEYRYRYVDFDTRTYVVKPESKPANLASSSDNVWPNTGNWTLWGNSLGGTSVPDVGTGYQQDAEDKVTELRLITYLNERNETGAVIEIELPRADLGSLPPPEFGPELYRLPLPGKIERNNWYKYDIEI